MPPIQVQVWNACQRNSASYDLAADRKLQVRGAPAAFYENYGRLEIYTGKSTIVIFSSVEDADLLLRVARSLRGVNVLTQPDAPLPQPANLPSVCSG